MYKDFIKFVREIYNTNSYIALHEPSFIGNEKLYLNECIDSTFVSSVGEYVDKFEKLIARFTGAKYAIATTNGTSALHVALKLSNVTPGDEVLTQPLTFIATCNAISYCGAKPVFIDVNRTTLGMSASSLETFLDQSTYQRHGICYNRKTNNKISAVVPMHTFGHPCEIDVIADLCNSYNIALIEDAAESLGSYYKNNHTGLFGRFGILSFNGNKIITTGGGGMILTNKEELAVHAKHITTTAKIKHPYEFIHDEIGFNYRLPNINAALGCAQMENLDLFLKMKKDLANKYEVFFKSFEVNFLSEPTYANSNYWLNTIILNNKKQRDEFIEFTNNSGIMTRPAWRLMNQLNMFSKCETSNLDNAYWLEDRIVNIPSGVKF